MSIKQVEFTAIYHPPRKPRIEQTIAIMFKLKLILVAFAAVYSAYAAPTNVASYQGEPADTAKHRHHGGGQGVGEFSSFYLESIAHNRPVNRNLVFKLLSPRFHLLQLQTLRVTQEDCLVEFQ
jgi:hypothetical protein